MDTTASKKLIFYQTLNWQHKEVKLEKLIPICYQTLTRSTLSVFFNISYYICMFCHLMNKFRKLKQTQKFIS